MEATTMEAATMALPAKKTDPVIEIHIPFQVAELHYGKQLADIVATIAGSQANEAKKHNINEFNFYLIYNQPPDPTTNDEQEFIKEVIVHTKVEFRCRGFRFKGGINLGFIPENVLNRVYERAKLICKSRVINSQTEFVPVATSKSDMEQAMVELYASIDKFTQRFNLDPRLAKLSKEALRLYNEK